AGAEGLDDPLGDQYAGDRLVAPAEALADDLDVRRNSFLLPGMHGPGAAHAAHDLIENEERTVAIADVAHGTEVARHCGDAARGGADDGLGHEGRDIAGAKALELGFELVREALDVLRFGLVGILPAVGEARRDK